MRDYLIVGQGIAGTVLGRQLEAQQASFHIIDGTTTPSASRIAAGVWNPIAVKRFLKAWLAEETVEAAKTFFNHEEAVFGKQFFFQTELLKLMSNAEERQQMEARFESLKPFVIENNTLEPAVGVDAPNGVLHIKVAGYVEVNAYLDACAAHWQHSGNLIRTHFEHKSLQQVDGAWLWMENRYKQVVFCEGISGMDNPWMSHLPLTNTKGQVLRLKIPDLETEKILNKQLFILPQANQEFRIGSTYEWSFEDLKPTEAGRQQLLEMLDKVLPKKSYEILRQDAGGRPTTRDRRPLIGALNESGLYVFNGLGSRGVLLVPYLAECMLRFLKGDEEAIPIEARLQRFKKK